MNDIEKLHQVIDALEKQSSSVTEFYGVLSAVNSTRVQIESAKALLAKTADEQKGLLTVSYKRFEEYGVRLTKLESLMATLVEIQNQALKQITALEFVTPEQHEQSRVATEKTIAEQFMALAEKVDAASVSQQSAMKSLRTIIVFGVLALAGGIAFIAKETFM